MPFNRAQRAWIYQAAKNVDRTVAFGSSKSIQEHSSILFLNCPYPTLTKDTKEIDSILIGPYCGQPYRPGSLFNISGMSFGALSGPAAPKWPTAGTTPEKVGYLLITWKAAAILSFRLALPNMASATNSV